MFLARSSIRVAPALAACRLLAWCLVLMLPGTLQAQAAWQWKDANGRMVFSDKPPPATVRPSDIIRQPAPMSAPRPAPVPASVDGAAAAPAGTAAPAAPPTLAEREAEFRKRQAEQQKMAKEAEEKAQRDARLRENCQRARSYLGQLKSGERIATVSPSGERGFLDDAGRAAEIRKIEADLQKNCQGF
jgi:hypothetical protein